MNLTYPSSLFSPTLTRIFHGKFIPTCRRLIPTALDLNFDWDGMKHTATASKLFVRLVSMGLALSRTTIYHEIFGLSIVLAETCDHLVLRLHRKMALAASGIATRNMTGHRRLQIADFQNQRKFSTTGSQTLMQSCIHEDGDSMVLENNGPTAYNLESVESSFSHTPVLTKETIDFLKPESGKIFFDGTLGGGGHAELLLKAGASVIACDRDPAALAYARKRLAQFGDRFICFESNYAEAPIHLASMGVYQFDGILLDLGVSSHQLDTAERGFSFQKEGPLDMRMGRTGRTAADIVNTADLAELVKIFREYGEESRAMVFATRIVRERQRERITTTLQLASLLAKGMSFGARHPATRVFQALRIAVNKEMESLEAALPQFAAMLVSQGRFAIITFHSLEDRMVKRFFKKHAAAEIDDPTWSAPRPNPQQFFNVSLPHSIVADTGELLKNRRARSARLRMAQKI